MTTTPFSIIAPGVGVGDPHPTDWRPLAVFPLLIIVGVTGVGKSTMLGQLARRGLPYTLLPDRRVLTDALIIAAMQRLDGVPEQPVTDRRLRFEYTRRYRELYPGGMAQALAHLVIDPTIVGESVLIFDGLRGKNEIEWAVQLLPQAYFIMLDAPDVVRVQRLLGRRDAFDQVTGAASNATGEGFAALGVADAAGLFTPEEELSLLALVQSGAVTADDLRAKLQIVIEERRSYDPTTTRAALRSSARDRSLIIDTTRHEVDAVADLTARQARSWGLLPGEDAEQRRGLNDA